MDGRCQYCGGCLTEDPLLCESCWMAVHRPAPVPAPRLGRPLLALGVLLFVAWWVYEMRTFYL